MNRIEDDPSPGDVLEIRISVKMDRQSAEAVQLEARRLLERQGLRIRAVAVTRAAAVDDGPRASAESV